ncbi:MAG: acyltransferase domain-containing protein, partial [Myxococcales bacterium]|nr:acyltransferase domain-containing protein [Myxococcales bacterium]
AERLDRPGAMATVALSEATLRRRLAGLEGDLEIAVVNGPDNVVVAGSPEPLLALMATLDAEGVFTRRIKVDYASHCSHVDELAPTLEAALHGLTGGEGPRLRMLSTVTLEWLTDATSARYWQSNLREPVRLWPALSEVLRPAGDFVIEMSPHPVLAVPLEDPLARLSPPAHLSCGMARGAGSETFVAALAGAWARGVEPRLEALWSSATRGHVIGLPNYPWTRRSYEPGARLGDPRLGQVADEGTATSLVPANGSGESSIEDFLLTCMAQELGSSQSELVLDVPLRELGFDSLMASHLRARLAERGVELPLLEILQTPSISALVSAVGHRAEGEAKPARAMATVVRSPWFLQLRPRPQAE